MSMSEKLCTLRTKGGGGGKYTETSLWTNSSPTSDFATQNVTLSDSIDNYKYIKIVWKAYKSATTTSSVIVLVNDFKSFNYVANYTVGSLASNNSSNQPYARRYVYVSDTVIGFHDALRIYAAATSNDMAIPLEILGLNELDHGGMIVDPLWTNPNHTSAFVAQTVSLDLSNYDAVLIDGVYGSSYIPHSGNTRANTFYIEKGQSYDACYGWVLSGNLWVTYRNTTVNANGVVFGGGYYYNNTTRTAQNTSAIPMAIYGVKNRLA